VIRSTLHWIAIQTPSPPRYTTSAYRERKQVIGNIPFDCAVRWRSYQSVTTV
jgi:hypothetical protein